MLQFGTIGKTMKMETLAAVVRGHCNYYGVNINFDQIQKFWRYLQFTTYRMLDRRQQKRSMSFLKFLRIWNFYIPRAISHWDVWGGIRRLFEERMQKNRTYGSVRGNNIPSQVEILEQECRAVYSTNEYLEPIVPTMTPFFSLWHNFQVVFSAFCAWHSSKKINVVYLHRRYR